jgi:hypothetical protein
MKNILAFFLVFTLATSCHQHVLKGEALKNKLMETMSGYMNDSAKAGTTFIVKDVVFFPRLNKNFYDCTFTVEMKSPEKDTTGVMTAEITNDFKKVYRVQ